MGASPNTIRRTNGDHRSTRIRSVRDKVGARDVFGNLRFTCHHCGRQLDVIRTTLFGKAVEVPCWGSCGCEESKWDGLDIPDEDRKFARAGIPLKYLQVEVDLEGRQRDVYDGKSLYVFGPNGTGKSTFAANLGRALVNMGRTVMFRNSKLLTEEIKKTFHGENLDFLDRCSGVDVLVVDDMGKEQPTEYTLSMLYAIVESRYSAMKPMVVVSNYSRGELVGRWSCIDESTGRAIASRLCDGTTTVEMSGRDWRIG